MRQSTSQRKSKIELTCRLSAEKMPAHPNKENIEVTAPKVHWRPILITNEKDFCPAETLEQNKPKMPPQIETKMKKTRRNTSNLQINIECIEDEYAKKTVVKIPLNQDTPLFASVIKPPK